MYSTYLFIAISGLSGSLIYNAVGNQLLKPNVYESRKEIFNYGMLMGLTIGSWISYLQTSQKLSE